MTQLRAARAFTSVVIRTFVRDRTAMFFAIVLPVAVIVIIGTTFGGSFRASVGLVVDDDGPVTDALVDGFESAENIDLRVYATAEDLQVAIREQELLAGVFVEPGFESRAQAEGTANVGLVIPQTSEDALTAQTAVQGVIDTVGARVTAARNSGGDFAEAFAAAGEAAAEADGVAVEVVDVSGRASTPSPFSLTAAQNLVLFVFINATAGAVVIVVARRQGILRRVRATPTGIGTTVLGLGAGWFVWALLQSVIIIVIGAVAFGVDWGDPVAATLLVLVFAAVGCGAGLLVGAWGQDEDRVSAIAPITGVVLGAIGGCMVPLEVYSGFMQTVADFVPHSWAVRGWTTLIYDGGSVSDIATSLLVLTCWAIGLITVSAVLLRRQLARG